MPRLLVLMIAASVAIWVAIEFSYKAWELFLAGRPFIAVLSGAIAAFMVYLLQGYVRLAVGLVMRRSIDARPGGSQRPGTGDRRSSDDS